MLMSRSSVSGRLCTLGQSGLTRRTVRLGTRTLNSVAPWTTLAGAVGGGASVGPVPLEVHSAVGHRSGFVATVKPARDAIPLLLVQEAAAHERFQVRRDKVEEHQSTTARRADWRLQ